MQMLGEAQASQTHLHHLSCPESVNQPIYPADATQGWGWDLSRCKGGDNEDSITLWLVSHHHTQECLGGTLPPKPGDNQMASPAGWGQEEASGEQAPPVPQLQAWEPPRMDQVPSRAHKCLGPNTAGGGALL